MFVNNTYILLVSPMFQWVSSVVFVAVPSSPLAVAVVVPWNPLTVAAAVPTRPVADSVTEPAAVPRCPGDETPSQSTHSRRCRRRRGSGRWCTGTRQVLGGRPKRVNSCGKRAVKFLFWCTVATVGVSTSCQKLLIRMSFVQCIYCVWTGGQLPLHIVRAYVFNDMQYEGITHSCNRPTTPCCFQPDNKYIPCRPNTHQRNCIWFNCVSIIALNTSLYSVYYYYLCSNSGLTRVPPICFAKFHLA